jgi:class 3 adenylate cyclase
MPLSGATTRTVLELDLVSYSDIARVLEENLDVHAVKAFQDQIQSFVDEGLRVLGLRRDDVVFGTAGDNALLFFDDAATAHRFAEAVHRASANHNSRKGVASAKRWFRIGAATGAVLVLESERRIVGTTVSRAVRLEAAARRGQLVVDTQTFDALPEELKACYSSEEVVRGKREEQYTARRCTFIEGVVDPDTPPGGERGAQPLDPETTQSSKRAAAWHLEMRESDGIALVSLSSHLLTEDRSKEVFTQLKEVVETRTRRLVLDLSSVE